MEHILDCKVCGLNEAWSTQEAAQSAGVWHVYLVHPETWAELAGERMPLDHLPELYGRRLN